MALIFHTGKIHCLLPLEWACGSSEADWKVRMSHGGSADRSMCTPQWTWLPEYLQTTTAPLVRRVWCQSCHRGYRRLQRHLTILSEEMEKLPRKPISPLWGVHGNHKQAVLLSPAVCHSQSNPHNTSLPFSFIFLNVSSFCCCATCYKKNCL